MDDLTREDIGILIEAVEAWERSPRSDAFTGAMLGLMLSRKEDKEEAEARFKADLDKANTDDRKSRSVLLRAKLIGLRDSLNGSYTSIRHAGSKPPG